MISKLWFLTLCRTLVYQCKILSMSRKNIENLTQFREVLSICACFYSLISSIRKWHIFESQKTKPTLFQKRKISFHDYQRPKFIPCLQKGWNSETFSVFRRKSYIASNIHENWFLWRQFFSSNQPEIQVLNQVNSKSEFVLFFRENDFTEKREFCRLIFSVKSTHWASSSAPFYSVSTSYA